MVEKALPVTEVLYPRYSLCFLFDNTTHHSIYAQDAFQIKNLNKKLAEMQLILNNRWFDQENVQISQSMNFLNKKSKITQKKFQKVIEKR